MYETALLSFNIHTSYFSHAVNYSHEYGTFWYVWNICTTNFEILIGTSFSQMFNFRRVKNSHVFVTPVKNLFEVFTCDKYVRILHTCDRFVRMWKSNESVTSVKHSNVFVTHVKNSCKFFTDVTNTCRRRPCLSTVGIFLVLAQLDTEGNILTKF